MSPGKPEGRPPQAASRNDKSPPQGVTAAIVAHPVAPVPPRGGRDPGVPQLLYPLRVTGRLLVGHIRALADPDAPVYVTQVIEPGTPAVDARCEACVTTGDFGQLGPDTMLILQHYDGCPWFAGLQARGGAA